MDGDGSRAVRSRGRRGRAPVTGGSEVAAAARRLLRSGGVEAVTLRGVARELGVTAPALYRYVDSHEHLLVLLGAAMRREAIAAVELARDAAPAHPVERMRAACRGFRTWSISHPAEFGVAFGQPRARLVEQPGGAGAAASTGADLTLDADDGNPAGVEFGRVFAALFVEVWSAGQPVDGDVADELMSPDREYARQLARYRGAVGMDGMPLWAVQRFLGSWVRIFGMVAIEVFGHLAFALADAEPLFESELAAILTPPGPPPR